MIEVKKKTFDRKWGFLVSYDVFVDGVHVARVPGGHLDCTAKVQSNGVQYDSDGDSFRTFYNPGDCIKEFRMTPEIKELCEKKQPCLLYEVTGVMGTFGPYNYEDAKRKKDEFGGRISRLMSIRERISTVD